MGGRTGNLGPSFDMRLDSPETKPERRADLLGGPQVRVFNFGDLSHHLLIGLVNEASNQIHSSSGEQAVGDRRIPQRGRSLESSKCKISTRVVQITIIDQFLIMASDLTCASASTVHPLSGTSFSAMARISFFSSSGSFESPSLPIAAGPPLHPQKTKRLTPPTLVIPN